VSSTTRMGGHFVQGHVDGTGIIREKRPEKESLWITVACSPDLLKYIVPKGYIAVDGTSLTVCDVGSDYFTFMLVAHTQTKVIIPRKNIGDKVNLEVDITGKYIERLIPGYVEQAVQEFERTRQSGSSRARSCRCNCGDCDCGCRSNSSCCGSQPSCARKRRWRSCHPCPKHSGLRFGAALVAVASAVWLLRTFLHHDHRRS